MDDFLETFNMSKYLGEHNKKEKIGKCKGCQKVVRWRRYCIAGHIRGTCPVASKKLKRKFAKKPDESLNQICISDYLQDRDISNRRARCRGCLKVVYWQRKYVASHIRAGCPTASEALKRKFALKGGLNFTASTDTDELAGNDESCTSPATLIIEERTCRLCLASIEEGSLGIGMNEEISTKLRDLQIPVRQ